MENRDVRITVRYTEKEHAQLMKKKKINETRSDYIRRRSLK